MTEDCEAGPEIDSTNNLGGTLGRTTGAFLFVVPFIAIAGGLTWLVLRHFLGP